MHELSLAQNICDVVTPYQRDDQKIATIVVECGPLSGVVRESLEYCFSIIAGENHLGSARLEVRQLSAQATCPSCDHCCTIDNMWATCNKCGHSPLTVHGGREFRIKEIEVVEVQNV